MMMNDRESTRRTFAAVKIKNLKQPLQKYKNKPFDSAKQSTDETTHKNNGTKYDKQCN
jgi:hypothetical protein